MYNLEEQFSLTQIHDHGLIFLLDLSYTGGVEFIAAQAVEFTGPITHKNLYLYPCPFYVFCVANIKCLLLYKSWP